MTIFSKLFKRFSYSIICCFFCCLNSSAIASDVGPKARVAGIAPEAIDVKNFYIQNISGVSQILPLIGKDSDGTIASFRILTIPNSGNQGRLYLNGVPVSANQVLTPVEGKRLQFDPRQNFNGNATFTYTVTDNEGLTDATAATFTIPVTNNASLLVCSGGGLGTNILGAQGTFSAPYITPNPVSNCINNGSTVAAPLQNLGSEKPELTNYNYASANNSLGAEGTYSFLKTLGTMATRNCIKTDWVASDHTGDGGYAMIVNGSPDSSTFGETFYKASITVCPNTLYEFSAYVINILPGNHTAAAAGSEPNISFYINDLLVSTSGPIAYAGAAVNYVPQWVKVGGLWYSGPNTSVDLRIDNATFVAGGNDLGLDDISMAICGPDISYPNISLTPQYCSYGVLPLKADVRASVNTYSSYIFQNSTDGGINWIDMGTAKTGSPVFNASLNTYEYVAEYGDIPIIPSMDGYRYRLKVATEASNLNGTTCSVSADKIITVSTMNIPVAGTDIVGCNSATTAKLTAAGANETWAIVAGNPASAIIDQSGNISGMTVNGIYRFQLSNTAGCSDTINVTRDEVKSAGVDVTICSPATTLKLADAGTGYKWEIVGGNPAAATINAMTGDIAGLTADGIYHFILRSDYGGCTDEVLVTKSTITLSGVKTDVLCSGTSTGAIDLNVSGGTGPYTYSWSNGQVTEDLSNVAAGSYSVTVTDSKGCTALWSVTISQPSELMLGATKTDLLCFGASNGSIDLSVSGGTAPYTYAWTGGITTEDLSGLPAGTYSVTVTDANNCTAALSVGIIQPLTALALSPTKTDVLCFGSSTGAINLSVTGGTAPYTYSWTGGIATEDLSGLAAGTYSVTVTDANNCTATASVIIAQPSAALALSFAKTDVLCFGASTGAINLSVTGGTAPYTYSWTGGIATEDLSGLAAGTYNVTVTDANNCTATASVIIAQPAAALALGFTKTDVLCFGSSTGEINLTVSGGTAPYTYSWTGGITTEDLSGLAAGTYSVTVTDANNCTATASVIIAQPSAALALSFAKTDVLCFGASTGAINLSVTGGTAPYTYSWTGGITTEDLSGLAAGTYDVTVTDANNCTATASVIITQPAAALTLSSAKTGILCFGASTGAINLTVSGGTAPYTYSWTGGITTEDISGLAAGTYNVTVTDANNCTATTSVIIAQPAAALALGFTKTDILCFGASTGAINLTVSGGTAPYTYSWSGGITTEDISGLAAGTYNVTVTDANNCTATASVIIAQPAAALALGFTKTDVLCFGSSTGEINLTVSGGTAPYTYSWTGGIATEDLSGLAAGTYDVTVTDANNCTATASVIIAQPAAALALSSTKTDVLCFGASTGAINLSVTGGTAPYTYSWTGGIAAEDLSGLAAGTYDVTVTDANNCTATASVIIAQPAAALALSSTKIDVLCFGASTGAINLSVTGGTAPYTYSWTGGIATEDLSGLAAGTYDVTVTDANNCTATASVIIAQPAAALALSSTKTDVLCFGASTGAINLSVTGGTAPYTYSWTGGITTEDLSGLAAGTYNVTVTDANNCTATASVIIAQPAAALALGFTKTDVLCFGSSTGEINLTVSGGTAPYTYSWTGGIATEDLSGLAAGTYDVTVTDANNCTATASVIIAQPAAALALSSTKTDVLCFGASTGAINLSVTGGTAPYTYSWTGGITTEDLSGLAAGTYNVTVTDANNCTATASVIIAQPAAALALGFTKTDVLCFGSSTGEINLTVSGGTAPYIYSWTGGIATEDLSGLTAGTYDVTVTDANNCTATASVNIAQPSAALALSSAKTDVLCFGASTGAISLSVIGGTAPYTYSWTGGITTEDLSGLTAGTYDVTVTDANNCTATASVIIAQPSAALALSSTKTDILCFGASTGAISLSVIGGTAPYTYSWTGGITTEDLSGLTAGTYDVTVTDANNCTATASVNIAQPSAALALSSAKTDVLCFGASTGAISLSVIGGTAPYTYSWTGGITTEDLSGLTAGTYDVTVTDANNCTATASVIIAQPSAALALSSTKTDILCFGASTGAINLTVSGGTAPYTYAWTGGITTEDLSGLTAGTYDVTVTDANNCTATASVNIAQPSAALALSSAKTDILCFGASTGAINLTVSGGTAPYTYSWTGSIATEDLSGLAAGTYDVTVTDANNCTATASVIITQPAAALTLSSTKTDILCFGASTGAINLTVSGGTAPYTYSWTGGIATEDLSGLTAGTYDVTVTDANNCTATASVIIAQPSAALALSSAKTDVLCFGASTGAINLTVSGGTAPYTYSWTGGIAAEDLSGLAAGTYDVTVTDANNCTATASVIITQPAAALTLSSTKTDILCFGASTGAINLTVSGGTAPYTYSWTGGIAAEDLSGLTAGTYDVTVTDANNCTATASVIIAQPSAALALSSIKTDVLCFGASTGAINLSITGGTAPYTYSWTGGITTEDLSGLTAGTYDVTVTDANNCTATASVIIAQPAAALALSSIKTDVLCFGASTGAINLTVSGGTAPYTYSWTGGITTEDLSGLAAGTYDVTVTDANNCTATTSVIIAQPSAALALSFTKTDILCFGASTGAINLSVTGGTAPYTYSWTGGMTTEDLSGLPAGTYSVTVTDANSCSAIASVTVSQPIPMALNYTKTDVYCYGSNTGAIDLSVSGGTAPYRFSWTGGIGTQAKTTEDLTGLLPGTYRVIVTDAANCTVSSEVTIIQPEPLNAALTVKNASCLNADGNITGRITGGITPYKISWKGNSAISGSEIKNVKAGIYEMSVTDAVGCTVTVKAEVMQGTCAPVAQNDNFNIDQDKILLGDVAPNDTNPQPDKLTFTKITDPKNGKIAFEQDGKFTFTPDNGFSGAVEFVYQVCNTSGACHTAKVAINVSAFTIVSLTPELSSVWEGKKVAVTARLVRPFNEDVTITVEYGGKSERERDYLVLDQYLSLKIPKGSLSTTEKMTIAALNDGLQEGDEDIILKIKTVSSPGVHIGAGAVVIINDVYPPPPPTDVPQDEPINAEIVPDPLMSPNGDGQGNEFFAIQNIESYPDNEVLIFNRWGNELFAIKNYNNSDRNFKGFANKGLLVNQDLPLTDGVYFYIITTYRPVGPDRVKQVNKGYLILKR